jgi:hypothetical protein
VEPSDARSPIPTGGDIALVVDLHDSSAVSLYKCEVHASVPRHVLDVSVGGVRLSEEIPTTWGRRSINLGGYGKETEGISHSKKFWPWCLVCNV